MQFLKGDIQEGILKAAEEVFLEKGYKDASMREIASRAGDTTIREHATVTILPMF